MKHILLFICSLITIQTFAQTLNEEQVNQYLNSLQQEEIISEYGKDVFLKSISKNNPAIKQWLSTMPFGTLDNLPDSLLKSRAAILGFVGVLELMRNVGSAADELVYIREMTEKILGESMFFKPDLDGDIDPKNPISLLGLGQNLKATKEQHLVLAEKLKRKGLIDERVYNELVIWLQRDRIKLINDFGFFIYAARQTWFYDNYEQLKSGQLKLIDKLQAQQMMMPDKAALLKQSYKPFELKSRVEILSNCSSVIIIPEDNGYFTRQEIYEQFYQSIKSVLLPKFDYSKFSVVEIKKSADELSENPVRMQMRIGNNKDKKNFRLQYTADNQVYAQKADTDFNWMNTFLKNVVPEIYLDSNVIKSYSIFFSPLAGISTRDFQSVNDFLTDQKSTKRLLVVANDLNPLLPIKDPRKALILVDSVQHELFKNPWQETLSGMMSREKLDFTDKLSRKNLRAILKQFQENDIVPNSSDEATDKAIVNFRFEARNKSNVKRSLILSYPDVAAKVNLTIRKGEEKNGVFKKFVSALAAISRGKFNPQKVTDNLESEVAKGHLKDRNLVMSFRLNDKKHEYKQEIPKIAKEYLKQDKSMRQASLFMMDEVNLNEYELIDVINASLEENKIDGAFYKINANYATLGLETHSNYVFLSRQQYDYLENNHQDVFNEPVNQNLYHSYQTQTEAFSAAKFADALNREKLITDEALKELDIKNAKEPSDVLKASTYAVLIDMNELKDKNDNELYVYVLKKISSSLLPALKFSDVLFKEIVSPTDSSMDEEYLVSMKINGQAYDQTLFSSLAKVVKGSLDSLAKEHSAYFQGISENQFKSINDYLTDIGSKQRLVIVCDYRQPMLSVVLLDSTQASRVPETLPNNYVSITMYEQKFSRDNIRKALAEFSNIGLTSPMDDATVEELILRFRRGYASSRRLLEMLPKVVMTNNIWRLDSFKDVYKAMVDSLKSISRGHFNPVKVEDNFRKTLKKSEHKNRTFKYSFELNHKKYTETVFIKALPKIKTSKGISEHNYFDFETLQVIELINKALAEQNSEYAFYFLTYDDDESGEAPYVFLSHTQYRWLKNRYPELFLFDDDMRMYEMDKIDDKNKN